MSGDSRPHRPLRLRRVCRVSVQIAIPRPNVKVAQITTSQPCARSQPRFVGRNSAGSERRNVTKTKIAFTTPATQSLVLLLMYPLSSEVCHDLRHSSAAISTCRISSHRREAFVPVSGHWPSSTFCVTLFTVGSSRKDCSDNSEKPKISPPQPAKRKSIPTKTIMSLVGMAAILRSARHNGEVKVE